MKGGVAIVGLSALSPLVCNQLSEELQLVAHVICLTYSVRCSQLTELLYRKLC